MAFTDRFYGDPFGLKKRSDRGDLLKDAENTFYGGGTAPPPSPTPTPTPTKLAMLGDPVGILSKRQNAASRVRSGGGRVNVPSDDPVSGSRYFGENDQDLGPQYNSNGSVNPLPSGARGIQGGLNSQNFNRTLNGSQPSTSSVPSISRPLSHTDMATDIARRNLTAAGSSFGQPQTDVLGVGQPQQNSTPETLHFLPPGFTAAVGSTGVPGSTPNDIHFLPPGFSSVSGTVGDNKQLQVSQPTTTPPQAVQGIRNDQDRNIGYGSAYSY